jgi:hypothetical protein
MRIEPMSSLPIVRQVLAGDPLLQRLRAWATRQQLLIIGMGMLSLGAIWGAAYVLVQWDLQHAREAAAIATHEIAHTYQAQALRALREIDQTLLVVKYAAQHGEPQRVLQDLREHNLLPPDMPFTISVADASGRITDSNREQTGRDVSRTEYFAIHRHSDALYIGLPHRSGDEWQLVFSRRLDAPDGSFAGVALLQVDASYFVSSYEPSQMGKQGMLALLGSDDIFRVRRIGSELSFDDRAPYAELLRASSDDRAGAILLRCPWDGVLRYVHTAQLGNFPLAVIVGLGAEEAIAAASFRARAYVGAGITITVVLVIALLILSISSARLTRSRQRELEARLSAAMESGRAALAKQLEADISHAVQTLDAAIALLSAHLNQTGLEGLERAVALLRTHQRELTKFLTEDERGRHLTDFLERLSKQLIHDRSVSITRLEELRAAVDYLQDIARRTSSRVAKSAKPKNGS